MSEWEHCRACSCGRAERRSAIFHQERAGLNSACRISREGTLIMDDISPQAFVDAVSGYQKTAAVKAAVALDLFTAIANENGELERIAKHVQASERGVRILCDYLTVQGFLNKEAGRYRLTPSTAAFLTTSSPARMGSIVDFYAAPEMMALWLEDPVA